VLILLGDGVVAAVLLNRSKAQNAGWLVVTTAWAFAVIAGILTARAVGSPGYINPVGPLAGVLNESLSAERLPYLVAGEFLGAFTGAVLVWLHYFPHFAETPDATTKLGVFCTIPAIRNPAANFLSEAIGTFVLVFVGTAITEKEVGKSLLVPLGGVLVWSIGLSLGATTGYAINPVRDLGPRLAHFLLPIAGKGPSDWGYAWVPIVGPLVGGAAAAMLAKQIMLP
jgi:glycerol uptake facilitator protein